MKGRGGMEEKERRKGAEFVRSAAAAAEARVHGGGWPGPAFGRPGSGGSGALGGSPPSVSLLRRRRSAVPAAALALGKGRTAPAAVRPMRRGQRPSCGALAVRLVGRSRAPASALLCVPAPPGRRRRAPGIWRVPGLRAGSVRAVAAVVAPGRAPAARRGGRLRRAWGIARPKALRSALGPKGPPLGRGLGRAVSSRAARSVRRRATAPR